MNIQIFGKKKCFDTRKAERYFKERRIKYQYIDLVRSSFSDAEVLSFARQGADSIIAHLDRADIVASARQGARKALTPLLRHAGFAPGNVDIDFRPDFKAEETVLKIETLPNEIQLQKQ